MTVCGVISTLKAFSPFPIIDINESVFLYLTPLNTTENSYLNEPTMLEAIVAVITKLVPLLLAEIVAYLT